MRWVSAARGAGEAEGNGCIIADDRGTSAAQVGPQLGSRRLCGLGELLVHRGYSVTLTGGKQNH